MEESLHTAIIDKIYFIGVDHNEKDISNILFQEQQYFGRQEFTKHTEEDATQETT